MNAKPITSNNDYPVIGFKNAPEWRQWLEDNHDKENGVWMRIYRKETGMPTIDRIEALDEALCYGWIDGQSKLYDEVSYLQKYTPRRKRSNWSKRNIENIERLSKEGKMTDAGWREVETAKQDGRWERAYAGPANMEMPEDFLKALSKDKKAASFFETLNKANKYAIYWRLETAKKPETRERRKQALLAMLSKGQKIH